MSDNTQEPSAELCGAGVQLIDCLDEWAKNLESENPTEQLCMTAMGRILAARILYKTTPGGYVLMTDGVFRDCKTGVDRTSGGLKPMPEDTCDMPDDFYIKFRCEEATRLARLAFGDEFAVAVQEFRAETQACASQYLNSLAAKQP